MPKNPFLEHRPISGSVQPGPFVNGFCLQVLVQGHENGCSRRPQHPHCRRKSFGHGAFQQAHRLIHSEPQSKGTWLLVESNVEVQPHRGSYGQWPPSMALGRMRHTGDDGAPLLLIQVPLIAQLANGLLVPATGILPACKSSSKSSARLRVFSSEHYSICTCCAVDSLATHYVKMYPVSSAQRSRRVKAYQVERLSGKSFEIAHVVCRV